MPSKKPSGKAASKKKAPAKSTKSSAKSSAKSSVKKAAKPAKKAAKPAKKAAKPAKKATKAAKPARKPSGKPNALQQPLQPSRELAAVVGSAPLARGAVVSKIWDYIKKNKLQNPANKREILADDKLQPVFGNKKKVSMFEMNKHLAAHLK